MTDPQFPPQGALRQEDGRVLWRVWAPHCRQVSLAIWDGGTESTVKMTAEGLGYFVCSMPDVPDGLRYAYRLDGGEPRPDPASRWQPEGVNRPSAVVSPQSFVWSDEGWRGVSRADLVIYELHVGTFTPQGTFAAAAGRIGDLKELGVSAIEVMPVSQFPGERNWGYDGVHPYAVQNSYGGPQGFQQFVDACHQRGMAVILDVVYNHLGPEGSYFRDFGPYFTDRYHTPWGAAINFDGADCDPVRQFVVDNACGWVRDFHVDGLRLDAVQTIYDFGARHILAEIKENVERVAAEAGRTVHVIAETNQNDARLLHSPDRGGYGLDGVWSDDFHHSVHALLSGEREGYYEDFGAAGQIAKVLNDGFVYDGCYSVFRRRRVGSRVGELEGSRFVVCIQNHDQVGNRAMGDRASTYLTPAQQRLACGLLMLSPFTPLLFMGEEYAEEHPFPFFCSFLDPELVEKVREGRRREFAELKFEWGSDIPDPQSPDTFAAARLSWSWPEGSHHARMRALYRDLLAARRKWPGLRDRQSTQAQLAGTGTAGGGSSGPVLLVTRGRSSPVTACANLGGEPAALPADVPGERMITLTTEDAAYGGARRGNAADGSILPYELLIWAEGDLAQ